MEYLFWIWPEGYLDQAHDGVWTWIKESPNIWIRHKRQEKDPVVSKRVADNLSKLVLRGYIPGGMVISLI